MVATAVQLVTQSNLVVKHFGKELDLDVSADLVTGELGLVHEGSLEDGCLLRAGDGETWRLA